MPLADNRAVA